MGGRRWVSAGGTVTPTSTFSLLLFTNRSSKTTSAVFKSQVLVRRCAPTLRRQIMTSPTSARHISRTYKQVLRAARLKTLLIAAWIPLMTHKHAPPTPHDYCLNECILSHVQKALTWVLSSVLWTQPKSNWESCGWRRAAPAAQRSVPRLSQNIMAGNTNRKTKTKLLFYWWYHSPRKVWLYRYAWWFVLEGRVGDLLGWLCCHAPSNIFEKSNFFSKWKPACDSPRPATDFCFAAVAPHGLQQKRVWREEVTCEKRVLMSRSTRSPRYACERSLELADAATHLLFGGKLSSPQLLRDWMLHWNLLLCRVCISQKVTSLFAKSSARTDISVIYCREEQTWVFSEGDEKNDEQSSGEVKQWSADIQCLEVGEKTARGWGGATSDKREVRSPNW